MKKKIVCFLTVVCVCMVFRLHISHNYSKVACLAMSTPDSVFIRGIASNLESELEKNGYAVHVVYCEKDINKQLNNVQNFIAMDASIIIIDCIGDSETYEEVIREACENGIRTMLLNGESMVDNANVQLLSSSLYKGICANKMVTEFLDKQYADAEEQSVDVLLLGVTNNTRNLQATAGCQLLSEQFIRYYDAAQVSFVRYEIPQRIRYVDGYGRLQEVNEPAGGLVLDENGMAILNPYFDARVNLVLASKLNIVSNLDGQTALDTYLTLPEGKELCAVVAISGEAAVGAEERLLYYQEQGGIDKPLKYLAVFGSDDTEKNWELFKASHSDESLLRGFTGNMGDSVRIEQIVKSLIKDERNLIVETNSFFTKMTKDGKSAGRVTLVESELIHYGIFDWS